jgi:hypothetical protein
MNSHQSGRTESALKGGMVAGSVNGWTSSLEKNIKPCVDFALPYSTLE